MLAQRVVLAGKLAVSRPPWRLLSTKPVAGDVLVARRIVVRDPMYSSLMQQVRRAEMSTSSGGMDSNQGGKSNKLLVAAGVLVVAGTVGFLIEKFVPNNPISDAVAVVMDKISPAKEPVPESRPKPLNKPQLTETQAKLATKPMPAPEIVPPKSAEKPVVAKQAPSEAAKPKPEAKPVENKSKEAKTSATEIKPAATKAAAVPAPEIIKPSVTESKARDIPAAELPTPSEEAANVKEPLTLPPPTDNAGKDSSNDELREQLKLQLAAYTDYLHEQLHLQRQELSRDHAVIMEERLLQEKMRYQQELVASIARLQEIERVLHVREKLDASEHKSRQLWLVCQILTDALKSNPADATEIAPRNILKEVKAVIEKVNESEPNSLAQLALKSLPKAALEQGVYTEDALISRFDKVDRLAKRVSLIGDEGASLWRYLLSYLQSALIIERTSAAPSADELQDKEFNASALDTYALLSRVRYHLRQRNLEMSLRYANQLRGEPRRVAADWIKDVRTHLETRQAANILLAQAASVSIRTLNN